MCDTIQIVIQNRYMEYAPIVIGTLCRYEHFKKAIESLENNEWAKYTNIYIGVDYPCRDSHWDGYRKIVNYLNTTRLKFKSTNVYVRKENYGVERNYKELRKAAFRENGMVISSEDDNEFSPNFIEYMDTMLNLYRDDNDIVGVCGYSYPIEWNDNRGGYVLNRNFFSAWGWATWENKWSVLQDRINSEYFKDIARDKKRMSKVRVNSPKSYYFLTRMIGKNNISTTDVTISIYMIDNEKYCIMPSLSMVRNCGWDGSGVNCDGSLNYDVMNQKIDDRSFISKVNKSQIKLLDENMRKLNELFPLTKSEYIITNILGCIIQTVGVKFYSKMRKIIKR